MVRWSVKDLASATEESAAAAQVVARSEEGPDQERLVEDRREEKEHREFEGVETSSLIESVAHSGCKIIAR